MALKDIKAMITKFFHQLKIECFALASLIITSYPDTALGIYLRKKYWSKKFKIPNLRHIGKGAQINSRDRLVIGNNFILGNNAVIENVDSKGCFIGDYVGIARGSYLKTADHNLSDIDTPFMDQGHIAKSISYKDTEYSVIIEDNVWIGANCIILSGANIGQGAVISAGSVVSSEIPPYCIAVGNPARVVINRKKTKEIIEEKKNG
jgi:acetyltransferase-like isoleucine patch superfamily enzyme